MGSKNPIVGDQTITPDNQQERLRDGWVVGFVDGEGCFSAPVVRNSGMTLGWQVQPSFAVAQSASSRSVLEDLVTFVGCGRIYVNRRRDNHKEDLLRYCVNRREDLTNAIIPFFQANQLRTNKRANFEKFAKIIELMNAGTHLSTDGLAYIAGVSETMNHKKPSEYLRILRDHTPAPSISS